MLYDLHIHIKKTTVWHLFMDEVQLPQGCRVNTTRKFTFNRLHERKWLTFGSPKCSENEPGLKIFFVLYH